MAKAIYNRYSNIAGTVKRIIWGDGCPNTHTWYVHQSDTIYQDCDSQGNLSNVIESKSGTWPKSPVYASSYSYGGTANYCKKYHSGVLKIDITYCSLGPSASAFVSGTIDAVGTVKQEATNTRGPLIGQVTLDYGSVSTTSKNPDGYWYTLVKQLSPPSAPAFILLPDKIQGGSPCAVSWGAASDPDGDLSGYQLERSTNGGAYAQVYKGSASAYSDPVAYGLSSVRYRVCAYDAQGQYGPYKESDLHTVINNIAPEISGEDTSLGVKTEGFSYIYSVSNAEEDEAVAVTLSLDGAELETFQAVMGQEYMADLTGERWITALNGEHTLSIQAVDAAGERCQRNITFTKNVSRLRFQLSEPLPSEAAAYKTVVNLMAVIPPGALLTVELCNNGYDEEPTWEDVSNSVKFGDKYFFQNTTKTAERWGYNIRVTLDRNGAVGDCYVENAGGAFEYGTV